VTDLAAYPEIWAADFEFYAPPGERPAPVSLVARELRTGRTIRQWRDEFTSAPPFRTDAGALFVAYYASAELGCFRALDWQMPEHVLDLFTEFRNLRNGLTTPAGYGLLGALAYFGLSTMADSRKEAMRELVMTGGPWSAEQRRGILDYCEDDVRSLERLLGKLAPHVDLPRALLRGRYMKAAARIEWNGIPVDTDTLALLRGRWEDIKAKLIAEVDADYGVFEGSTFKLRRFEQYLIRAGIPWPRLPSGQLDLSDDTFREQARSHLTIAPLRELRDALSKMRLSALAVGSDGRNRTLLSAFRARTGRNQPSNSRYIFGPSAWLRSLIKPTEGNALVYIDWSSQEFGIAAALSGDVRMREAYYSGDPYLAFAKQAGGVPADAKARARRLQGRSPWRRLWHGGHGARRPHRCLRTRGSRTTTQASGDLPPILGLVAGHRRRGVSDTAHAHRVRVAGTGRPRREPAFTEKFPHAGEWRGDAALVLLPSDRVRHSGVRPRPRRGVDRSARGQCGGRISRDAGVYAIGRARRARRF